MCDSWFISRDLDIVELLTGPGPQGTGKTLVIADIHALNVDMVWGTLPIAITHTDQGQLQCEVWGDWLPRRLRSTFCIRAVRCLSGAGAKFMPSWAIPVGTPKNFTIESYGFFSSLLKNGSSRHHFHITASILYRISHDINDIHIEYLGVQPFCCQVPG